MSDTNDTTRRSGSGPAKTLSLKKTETSTVKQSFSHGRTKAVVVEKKRTRVETTGKSAEKAPTKEAAAKAAPATATAPYKPPRLRAMPRRVRASFCAS